MSQGHMVCDAFLRMIHISQKDKSELDSVQNLHYGICGQNLVGACPGGNPRTYGT